MSMKFDENDDRKLVERAQNGNKKAFESLVEKHKQKIFNKCYFDLFCNEELAKEAAHMTFIKAFISIRNFRGKSKFFTWLFKIAENTCKDFKIKEKIKRGIIVREIDIPKNEEKRSKPEIFIDPVTPPIDLEEEERKKSVQECIERLNKEHREAINLLYYEGFSYQEAADKIVEPIGTVKSRRHRAIENLQDCLRNKGLLK